MWWGRRNGVSDVTDATATSKMNFGFMGRPTRSLGRSVAVIGAGPSGLAAAGYLASVGYRVEVYDKMARAGGLMVFGIPGKRIPADHIQRGIEELEKHFDVHFHLRTKICGSTPMCEEAGDAFTENVKSLGGRMEDNDAVLICTGAWKSRRLTIPGADLPGVHTSLEFLFPIRATEYETEKIRPVEVRDKRVAVIGAGHSAMDVAHNALASGAAEVLMVYRKTRREAPCGTREIDMLMQAGARWIEGAVPVRVIGEGVVQGLEVSPGYDEPENISAECLREGTVLPVDVLVSAIGEIPTPPFAHELGLDKVRKGETHWLQMTALDGVFVAGDVLIRPSKIGKAIYSGLRAARSLHTWLDLRSANRTSEYDYRADTIRFGDLA